MSTRLAIVNNDAARHRQSSVRVKSIRRGLGMTQFQFAQELRVSLACISNWERGVYCPSPLAEQAIRNVCVSYGFDLHTMRWFE